MTLLAVLVASAFAGCTQQPDQPNGPANIEADLITPGAWRVNGQTDHILAWVHNAGSSSVKIDWTMKRANGTEAPAEWRLRAQKPSADLQADGNKSTVGGRTQYPDWAWTLFTIELPNGTAAGEHPMVLDTGKSQHAFVLRIEANLTRVSKPADTVELHYDGKFNATGERFDDGEFQTRLGSGQTVPGFDNGLMGLAVGEDASLIIPPALGYGYDQTHPSYVKFNGQTLRFDVRILRFA